MNKKMVGILVVLIILVVGVMMMRGKKPVPEPKVNEAHFTVEHGISEGVSLFGEPVYGDLDGDGDDDAAVWLTYSPGGSGTFYYAAFATKGDSGYVATPGTILGDRIAPQTLEIRDGRAVYNYAVRKEGEPFTTRPSVGKSTWLMLDLATGELAEYVPNFEGESR